MLGAAVDLFYSGGAPGVMWSYVHLAIAPLLSRCLHGVQMKALVFVTRANVPYTPVHFESMLHGKIGLALRGVSMKV